MNLLQALTQILFASTLTIAQAQTLSAPPSASEAQPIPAIPPRARLLPSNEPKPASVLGGPTQYSIGSPTDEEQLYLEFINRSRSNPPAEGILLRDTTDPDVVSAYNFFPVDLQLMVSAFAGIAPAAPLSMNPNLTAAARSHSQDMFANQFQDHTGSDGKDPFQRMLDQGYTWSAAAENIFAYARSVFHGYAALNVDWGNVPGHSAGGMQDPPGHRINIHSPLYREIGLGVVLGSNGTVGPQLVTQDFGSRMGLTPFVTGVVYYDFNGNGFYDLGEGIGGVKVTIPGSSFFAITANSGGYSVPVPGNGSYNVTFSVPALPDTQKPADVAGNANFKVDFLPIYSPPMIAGPDPAGINQNNLYTFSAVGAATAYQWEQTRRVPLNLADGAENGLVNVTAVTSPGYEVISSDAKVSGNFSFHLAHPQPPVDQLLTFNRSIRPRADSQWIFYARLGWATSDQIAKAQVSTDAGKSWQDLWTKAGTGSLGDTTFTRQSLSLASFAGSEILIRFVYHFEAGGVYFKDVAAGVGFYVDDISVSNAEELIDAVVSDIPAGTSFNFTPALAGDYLLRVRSKVSDRFLSYGPAKPVSAQAGVSVPVSVRITDAQLLAGGQIQVNFEVTAGAAASFKLESSPSPSGPWLADALAGVQSAQPPSKFRAITATAGASQRYYRISAN